MFRPAVLRSDDAALIAARDEAIGVLSGAFSGSGASADGAVPVMALVSWTFAHGLVSLTRDGALQNISRDADVTRLTGALIDAYEAALS